MQTRVLHFSDIQTLEKPLLDARSLLGRQLPDKLVAVARVVSWLDLLGLLDAGSWMSKMNVSSFEAWTNDFGGSMDIPGHSQIRLGLNING